MKSINATLLASQKAPRGGIRAIARATLTDNGRLHPEEAFPSGSYTGGSVRGCTCGSFIFRLRYKGSGLNTLERQVISDPTTASQWTTWTAFETNLASIRGFTAFWTGTYVVVLWQDATDRKLYYRRSTDGSTWSSKVEAYDVSPNAASLGGVSGGASQSGAFVFRSTGGASLNWAAYNPTANTWATLDDSGLTFDDTFNLEVAGFYDSDASRHTYILNPVGYWTFARFALAIGHRTTGGTWSAIRPFYHSNRNNYQHLAFSQGKIGGFWWLSFHRARGWGRPAFWLACSNDGEHWEDIYPTTITPDPVLNLTPAPTGTTVYLSNERSVHSTSPLSGFSQASVVSYNLISGDAYGLATPARPRLVLRLDNRAGALAVPALNTVLTLERGYHIAGSDYYQPAGTFYVVEWRYLMQDQLLELTATDAAGLLDTWSPDQVLTWSGETIQTLVEQICARAGVHTASFDGAALWSETLATFSILANTSARTALLNLQRRAAFDFAVQEDGSISFYQPSASPSPGYTYGYGSGEHQYWPGVFGEREAITFQAVIGADVTADADDAYNAAAIAAHGRRLNTVIFDPRITSDTAAGGLADAQNVLNSERLLYGQVETPPNFALEIGDVIEFAGSTHEAGAGPWRVAHIEESFNEQKARPFFQRVTLRGTT